MTDTASCCTACAAGLANGGAACETAGSGPAGAATASGVALEARVSAVAELSPATPALEGALAPALRTVAAEPVARASPVLRELAPVRGNVVAAAPAQLQAPPPVAGSVPRLAPPPHLAQGIAMTMEEAHQLGASPQMSAGIAMTMEDSLALARSPASRAGLPPEPAAAVAPPPGNIALTMEHAEALARAPQFHQNIALTLEDAERLAKNPVFRAGISMTFEESLAFAEASQKNAAIALTMDDALALANSPASRAGLELYDRSSPDLMTNQRLSPEAVKAVLRGEHPVFPLGTGPSGPSSGPQQPSAGEFGKPAATGLPAALPLRVANALWTSIDVPKGIQITDVAAGTYGVTAPGGNVLWRPAVWAIGSDTSGVYTIVYRLVDGARLEQHALIATKAQPGRIAAARDTGEPFAFPEDGEVWTSRTSSSTWHGLLGVYPGVVDMAVGNLLDPYNPGIWWVDDEGTLYQVRLDGQAPNLHAVNLTIAGNIARVSIDADGNVWTVTRDGHVLRGEASEDVTPPRRATNVAAVPGGDAYVIGAQQASGITTSAGFIPPAGNEIWFWNHLTKTWSLIPGWGVAIDADNDGNLWIVDENGKVWNRGGRKFGFWELGGRSRPAPGETWCDFEKELDAPAGLFQDGVDRFVEGGASVLRIGQVSADPAGNNVTDNVTEPFALIEAANLGADVFVLFDVIRTNQRNLPYPDANNPDNPDNHTTGIPDYRYLPFDDPQMIDFFRQAFLKFKDKVESLLQQYTTPVRRFEDVIKYISIGGEVDVYLNGTQADQWGAWTEFYRQVSAYIRSVAPELKIGSVTTLHYSGPHVRCGKVAGAWGLYKSTNATCRGYLESLNESSDYIGFTSYPGMGTSLDPASDVALRIQQMLEIAGDKPVMVEEFGYPTYDEPTMAALQQEWPGHQFPSPFYKGKTDLACPALPIGICGQKRAVDIAFAEWDKAKVRLPVFIWFTAFEQHIEGDGCQCTPRQLPFKSKNVCQQWGMCEPCVQATGQDNPACHPCGALDGENTLGLGAGELSERFFGSCGLIRSNGVTKAGWDQVVLETAQRRIPDGDT